MSGSHLLRDWKPKPLISLNGNFKDRLSELSEKSHSVTICGAMLQFAFIRKQDQAALEAHLLKIGDGGAQYQVNDALDAKQGAFSFLLGAPTAPVVHDVFPKARIRGAADNYAATGCVCKIDNCDGKWPIAEMDARNEPEWPYACIQATKEDDVASVRLY
jgi:hypothetical protein